MIFLRIIDWEPELEFVVTIEVNDEPTEVGEFRFITDKGRLYWKHNVELVGFVVTPYGPLGSMVVPMEPDPPHPLLLEFLQKLVIKYKIAKREAGRTPAPSDVQMPFVP